MESWHPKPLLGNGGGKKKFNKQEYLHGCIGCSVSPNIETDTWASTEFITKQKSEADFDVSVGVELISNTSFTSKNSPH